jgi:hypothetical protein
MRSAPPRTVASAMKSVTVSTKQGPVIVHGASFNNDGDSLLSLRAVIGDRTLRITPEMPEKPFRLACITGLPVRYDEDPALVAEIVEGLEQME